MTSRREFLQIGITATAWPLAPAAVRAAAGNGRGEHVTLSRVIYDRRFAASREFGGRAARLGLPTAAIDGDMTKLWYDEIYHEWKQGPAAIAGLTGHGAMFCFEQLAQDQRMRLVFRVEHKLAGNGAVDHDLRGPLTMLSDVFARKAEGASWTTCMADVVARCPRGRAEIAQASASDAPGSAAGAAESLYSWVIAPAVNV